MFARDCADHTIRKRAHSPHNRFAHRNSLVRIMQPRSAALQARVFPCCTLHCGVCAAARHTCSLRHQSAALHRNSQRICNPVTSAAVAERMAVISQPDTAAEQHVAIPALEKLALRAILSLGFKSEDAMCILEVSLDILLQKWHAGAVTAQ